MRSGHSIHSLASFPPTVVPVHSALGRIHTWRSHLKAFALSILSAWKLLLALASPSQREPLFTIETCPVLPLPTQLPVPLHILFFSIIMYHHLIYQYACFSWNVTHTHTHTHTHTEKCTYCKRAAWWIFTNRTHPLTQHQVQEKLSVVSIPGGPSPALTVTIHVTATLTADSIR